MSKKFKGNAAKVSGINRKAKMSDKTKIINDQLLFLMQDTREYVLSRHTTPFIREFHKNQTVLVEDALWFGETSTTHLVACPSVDELRENPVSIADIGYKRMGVFLQLNLHESEKYDDSETNSDEDVSKFNVLIYAPVLSIYKDHVQLKIIKGTVKNQWFYDSYYYRMPLDFIESYIGGKDIEIDVRRSYEDQSFPSDEYLINQCQRFIKVIVQQLHKKKYQSNENSSVVITELNFANGEQYYFKIWQDQ